MAIAQTTSPPDTSQSTDRKSDDKKDFEDLLCGKLDYLLNPMEFGATIYGSGTSSCGNWVTVRSKKKSGTTTNQEQWLLGFLTAFNGVGRGTNDIAEGTDLDGLFVWIDNYCKGHPLEMLASAAGQLVVEIRSHKR